MKEKFKIKFLEEANAFLNQQNEKAVRKIIYNMRKVQVTNDKKLFKKLNEEIWEFRTLYEKKHFRFFAFWDKSGSEETLVVATHGIVKKTSKIPKTEIEKSERIRKRYLTEK